MSVRHWKYRGWVIDTQSDEGHGLIGRFWHFDGPSKIPLHLLGHRTAVFETRAQARASLHRVKRAFPRSIVRRATIRIEVEP